MSVISIIGKPAIGDRRRRLRLLCRSKSPGRQEKILQSRADRSANHVRGTEGGKRAGFVRSLIASFSRHGT